MIDDIAGEEEDESQSSGRAVLRKQVCWKFAYLLTGLFFNFSAFAAVFNLQTSINIEDGLGVTSVATTYLVSIAFGLFFTPFFLRRFGAKKCIIVSEVSYGIYILANLYPAYYTLVPAGVLMGFGEATIWPAISMMSFYFASQFTTATSKESASFHHIGLFMGYFYTVFQATQIFGNLISYAVLYGLEMMTHDTEYGVRNSTATNDNCTSSPELCDINMYAFCGSNDCQNASVINDNLKQYKPLHQTTLYVLIGILLIMIIMAIVIHVTLMPDIGSFVTSMKTGLTEKMPDAPGDTVPHISMQHIEHDDTTGVPLIEEDQQEENDTEIKSVQLKSGKVVKEGSCVLATATLRSILKHVIQRKQLLMLPIAFYNGISMAFAMGELTRAYASCVLGVEWVGVCMSIYGVSDCAMSWFSGRFGRRVGYKKLYIAIFVVELCNYLFCLLWTPSFYRSWPVFIVFFAFGFADGMTQTIVNVAHVDFFPANQEVALSVWNTAIILGFASAYSYSVALCVSTKIYMNIFFLTAGVAGAIGAEHCHNKRT